MKLIKPYTEILTPINGSQILKDIERVARTCYKSEDKITEDDSSAREIVSKLLKRGHEAMLEFGDITVKFVCDRGVSHEIVRHRLASYAQESTRYCNYGKDEHMTFIIPCWMTDLQADIWDEKRMHFYRLHPTTTNSNQDLDVQNTTWMLSMSDAEINYNKLLKTGWSPQQARSVLPNSLKTEINVKMNIREWRHFFRMRCSNAAHPQMTELTRPLLKQFQEMIPLLFDDINY
jgi:thymidylate synthase (FAD)